MNQAYRDALLRGAIGGLFLAGGTFFTVAPQMGATNAFYAAGGIFCGYMAARFAEAKVFGDANDHPKYEPPPIDFTRPPV